MEMNPEHPESRPNLEDARKIDRETTADGVARQREREQQREERKSEHRDWFRNIHPTD